MTTAATDQAAALLAAQEKLAAVRGALAELRAHAKETTDRLRSIPQADYGPAEWRLHGDARGLRMAVADIAHVLDGTA